MVVNTVTTNSLSSAANGSLNTSRAEAAAPLLADTASRQTNIAAAATNAVVESPATQPQQPTERSSESVRVSSSIGRAASAGQLTREQALEIYRNIARFL
ncbi:hypothetical protein SAMN06297280_2200 [Arsukibacterium tuosuense]|uniref:Uncharacterized protein n=2 Tax=Arsukibacterium tuosuense TaxID=1323745 RepID=A0A285IYG3_9GAMM|nr:hypothetical protein SAMN06297280_2200 [Arsukibacterium tuosuense]